MTSALSRPQGVDCGAPQVHVALRERDHDPGLAELVIDGEVQIAANALSARGLGRMYGAYANRTRGARARRGAGAALAPPDGEPDTATPSQRERRRQWARLIAKVFEVDPRRCSCGGTMRIVGFILDPAVIRKILQPRPRPEARAHAPPGG